MWAPWFVFWLSCTGGKGAPGKRFILLEFIRGLKWCNCTKLMLKAQLPARLILPASVGVIIHLRYHWGHQGRSPQKQDGGNLLQDCVRLTFDDNKIPAARRDTFTWRISDWERLGDKRWEIFQVLKIGNFSWILENLSCSQNHTITSRKTDFEVSNMRFFPVLQKQWVKRNTRQMRIWRGRSRCGQGMLSKVAKETHRKIWLVFACFKCNTVRFLGQFR